MSDIEKRARELLADSVDRDEVDHPDAGCKAIADAIRDGGDAEMTFVPTALRAIVAALTPPEGYVLVPVEPTEHILDALYSAESDMSDEALKTLWTEILAARPEVPE